MTATSPLWKYFYRNSTHYKTDRTHKAAWCTFCIEGHIRVIVECDAARARVGQVAAVRTQEDLRNLVLEKIEPVCGKADRMLVHIKHCKFISADDCTRILLSSRPSTSMPKTVSPLSSSLPLSAGAIPSASQNFNYPQPIKRSKSLHVGGGGASRGGIQTLARTHSASQLQEEFSADLCKLFIATNTPWFAAENPSLQRFIHKWVGSEVVVHDRRILSGRVLNKEVEKVDMEVKGKVQGKMATGQCDGWKNVAKESVVSVLMSVENELYLVQTHNVTREPKTGAQLLKHVLDDKKLMEEKFGVTVIAWCTDDGPDGKKMRCLLQNLCSWLIVILCWAHQINLVVGDFLVIRRGITEDINSALEVIKWFNNHSTALALLQTEQTLTFDGSFWALILPAITRWMAHYLAVTRYLKLKQPLQICWMRHEEKLVVCAGGKQELQDKARSIHALVKDEMLWERLRKIQKILEPLAIAANVAQASHTRLDHVLLMLGNLVRIFTQNMEFDEDLRTGIIKSLEKRWKKADQDIFITAVFLNPFIRASLFNKETLNDVDLYAVLERVYERVMRRKTDIEFLVAFEDYRLKHGEFSDERMGLELMKTKFLAEDAPVDLRLVWSRLDRDVDHGRNAIVKLAILIFTVIANSAGCERVFSNFGITHTKRRNKLDPKKVHDMAVVGMQIKREDRELGLTRNRKKRKFEEISEDILPLSSTSADTLEHVDPTDFRRYAEGLVRQAALSNQEDDEEIFPPNILPTVSLSMESEEPTSRPTPTHRNPKTQIPLLDLFNFGLRPEDGLEFYWPGSKKNLEELLAHENGHEGDGTRSSSTATSASTS